MNKFLLILTCVAFSLQAVAQEVTRDETTDNKQKTDARVFFQGGKLHFAGPNENFHLWLDNRINLESAIYKPTESVDDLTSKVNKDLEDDDTHFRFSNGTIVRRARFSIKATLFEKWFAELDLDFANNEV